MKTLMISLKIFFFFTILTGIIYPLAVTGISQIAFPYNANGSLIVSNNKIIGSELIGQQFDSTIYFSSRPSAVSYNPLPSGGSNLGPTSLKLKTLVEERRSHFLTFNNLDSEKPIPSEMLFASASGLDPHISPKAALLQVDRIVLSRSYNEMQKRQLIKLINSMTEYPQFFCLGDKRINTLLLNLELDKIGM